MVVVWAHGPSFGGFSAGKEQAFLNYFIGFGVRSLLQIGQFTDSRSHNAQNQVTSYAYSPSGSVSLTYDNAGNQKSERFNITFVYDAWNRLASAGSYDALNRFIGSRTLRNYYNGDDIIHADRYRIVFPGTARYDGFYQNVWGFNAVDHLIFKDSGNAAYGGDYGMTGSGASLRFFYTYANNWTTACSYTLSGTSLINSHPAHVDPYGNFEPSYGGSYHGKSSITFGSAPQQVQLHNFRNRWFNPSIGRFISRDPCGYVDGSNLYEFVRSSPVTLTDPYGLCAVAKGVYATAFEAFLRMGMAPQQAIALVSPRQSLTEKSSKVVEECVCSGW